MEAKDSSEASVTIYEVTEPKYLHWLSSLFKKKIYDRQKKPFQWRNAP